MARLKDRDPVEDYKGRLVSEFRAAALSFLNAAFIVHSPDREAAAQALEKFYTAMDGIRASERDFHERPRDGFNRLSIMPRLRGPRHFAALKEGSAAEEGLLAVNEKIGGMIVRVVKHALDTAAVRPAPQKAPAPTA